MHSYRGYIECKSNKLATTPLVPDCRTMCSLPQAQLEAKPLACSTICVCPHTHAYSIRLAEYQKCASYMWCCDGNSNSNDKRQDGSWPFNAALPEHVLASTITTVLREPVRSHSHVWHMAMARSTFKQHPFNPNLHTHVDWAPIWMCLQTSWGVMPPCNTNC